MKKLVIEFALVLIVIILGSFWWGHELEKNNFLQENQESLRVGVIFANSMQDGGWNQQQYDAFQGLQQELGLQLFYRENVPELDLSIEPVVDELVQKKHVRVIFALSYGYGNALQRLAARYPDIRLFHITGIQQRENLATYFGRMYQARYLTGIVAGMQTKTNQIGYVAAYPFPEVIRDIDAFTLGVRSVNPAAIVHVRWTWSWDDEAKEKRTSEKLLSSENIDVLTQHQNRDYPIQIAEEHHIYAIGYHADHSAEYPDTLLTSAIWNWSSFYRQRLIEYREGRFSGKNYFDDMASGLVDIAPLSAAVPAETREKVASARQRIESGSWDVFHGPIYDQNGWLRVRPEENIPDQVLVESMDWFVQGIEGTTWQPVIGEKEE